MSRWPGAVERAAARLVSGEPPIAAFVAPDGAGRTEVLTCAAEQLEQRDVTTVTVTARRVDRDVRFAALEELFDKAPGRGPSGERAARTTLLAELDGSVLLVDDAHWLDEASRRVLAGLAEEAAARGVGLVVTTRPAPPRSDDELIGAIARAGVVVDAEPVSETDVAERVERVRGRPPEPSFVDVVFEQTAGHARFVDAIAAGTSDDTIDAEALATVATDAVIAATSDLSPAARDALVALSLATKLDDELLAELVGVDTGDVPAIWSELRGAGLLAAGHDEPIAVVATITERRADAATRRDVHRRIADRLTARGAPATHVAEHVIASETRGADAAALLAAAAEAQLADAPEIARELLDRAIEAGADPVELAGARAEAAALAGDEDAAVALADGAVGGPPESVARAAIVLAGVLARRGLWARAIRTYETTTGHPSLPDDALRALGALCGVVTGRPCPDLREPTAGVTLGADVARLLGDVAAALASGDAAAARRSAGEAADLLEVGSTTVVLPETPHAIGAVVALAVGDVDAAELLLARALDGGAGGPAAAMRHRLLAGFAALRAGRYDRVQRVLDDAHGPGTTRDALLRAALAIGLARRLGDVGRLTTAWERAQPVIAATRSDLLLLPALAELFVAAARLRQADTVDERVSELDAVVAGLGRPGLWARPLAWARVEAAIAADDLDALESAAEQLRAAPPAHPRLAGLDDAATAWLGVLRGQHDHLDAGVAGLEQAGLVWEASRLVGQAAIRADDPSATRTLLGRARELQGTLPIVDESGEPTGTVLSAREREVAAAVVDGLTYKEIGAMLYISPKTVEHHVARIRQKLGATSRAEMLAGLRAALAAAED